MSEIIEKKRAELQQAISEENVRHPKKASAKTSAIFVVVLAVLTFASVLQTVQSFSILNKIDGVKASEVGNAKLPSNIGDLPDMVGGC